MLPGKNNVHGEHFAPNFLSNDKQHWQIVLGDEPDLARNLWLGRAHPGGTSARLYLRIAASGAPEAGRGHAGFFKWRTDGHDASQVRVHGSQAQAAEVQTAEGPCLRGDFTGKGHDGVKTVKCAGQFVAAPLDMRHRQLLRPEIEGLAKGWS